MNQENGADKKHEKPILMSIQPWLEGHTSFGPVERVARAGGGPLEGEEEAFSALDLRDRVVVMLLHDQVVRIEQVKAAWREWKKTKGQEDAPSTLWRVVARVPGVNAEAVFAEAARVYAFKSAIPILHYAQTFLRDHQRRFSRRQRRQLVTLGVLPIRIERTSAGVRWVFATHDPMRPAVHQLLADLDVPAYDLRYASEAAVREGLERALRDEDTRASAPAALKRQGRARRKPPRAPRHGSASPADQPAEALPARVRRGGAPQRTFVGTYEELLAGLVQSGASRVRLVVEEGRRLVATFGYEEAGEQRDVRLEVLPEAALSFMHRRASSRQCSGTEGAWVVHRWLEERRRSFRISALPGREAWIAGKAEVVIELVD